MLSTEEIKDILETRKNRATIQRAIGHQSRVRFHTVPTLEASQQYVTTFLKWVERLIDYDRFLVFKALLTFPLATVPLVDKIFSSLEKVLDGRNPIFKYSFMNEATGADWDEYLEEKGGIEGFQKKVFDKFKYSINSLVVVDLPSEQNGNNPEPYFYFADISSLMEYEYDQDNDCFNYAIIKQGQDKAIVYDSDAFQVFELDKGELKGEPEIISHDLGYCPVKTLWGDKLNDVDNIVMRSPISTHLGDADHLLKFKTNKRGLEDFAAYPIFWSYDKDCDYENEASDEECQDGFLISMGNTEQIERGQHWIDGEGLRECPVCAKSTMRGPGAMIRVPVPDGDQADLREPIGKLDVDSASLEYNRTEITRLETEMFESITGYGGEPANNQAVNQKQIMAAFESRKAVLVQVKKNIERITRWWVNTTCKLRYGSSFVDSFIDNGTEFFLYSAEELLELYEKARAAKLDGWMLDFIQDEYIETRYKNNPQELSRIKILKHLDPFRHLNEPPEGADLTESMLKQNFSSMIMKFEREQAPLTEFGELLDFGKRIERIKEILFTYVAVAA